MSKELLNAIEYETKAATCIQEEERAMIHLTPRVGWMNDPNGFSYYNGTYHLFYQYYPYDTNWGPMHWGHAITKDFIKWEYLPVALAPDQEYDKDGCWSGSAVETLDGKHAILYTAMLEGGPDGNPRQTQCLAIGDGRFYKKYVGNPVIDGGLLPEGYSKSDFRDPKAWFDKEEKLYYLVAGNRSSDGSGAVLLFQSRNLTEWKYMATLDRSNNKYGKMWECPDFFPLEGNQVLLVSPQEMRADGREFHYGNGTMCIIGNYEKASHRFERKNIQSIDQGLDFYAPQTVEAPDGRRIMIAWMQSWESCRNQPQNNRFFGMMTIPRELSIRDGRLIQTPVREIESYRKNLVTYENLIIYEETTLKGIEGRVLDMELSLEANLSKADDVITIILAKDMENGTLIQYYPESGLLRFDRSNCGFNCDILNIREILTTKNKVSLRIILDRYSAEIFVNGGERVMSNTFYTPLSARGISFSASSPVRMNISKWDM